MAEEKKEESKEEGKESDTQAANETSQIEQLEKRLFKFKLFSWVGYVICIGLVPVSVNVIVDASQQSMAAFNELPEYRVNLQVLAYRKAVKTMDESYAATQALLESDDASHVLNRSKEFPSHLLASEENWHALLTHYEKGMQAATRRTAGAAEWSQHFNNKISALKERSMERQTKIATVVGQFPDRPPEQQ